MIVVGLMSGTSMDAVDAAAAELILDGDLLTLTPLGMISRPYPAGLRDELAASLPPAATSMQTVCRLDTLIGQHFAAVASEAVGALTGGRADLIASHGQTVFHWVDDAAVRGTLQLGQPAWIAAATGLPVVADFRPADIAAGGQGAPLVSAFDLLWLAGRPGRSVALNLGGIANLTVAGSEPIAFDTGPANTLLDAAMVLLSDGAERCDRDGARAGRGRVRADLWQRITADPYFARPAPKSTGREHFHRGYLRDALDGVPDVDPDDLLATLTEVTASTVAAAVLALGASEVIAAGGGVRNATLMARLGDRLGDVTLRTSDELGLPTDAKEAYAFAVLGFLTAHGLPGNVPECTGARRAVVLGSLTPGRAGLPVTTTRRDVVPPRRLQIRPGRSLRAP